MDFPWYIALINGQDAPLYVWFRSHIPESAAAVIGAGLLFFLPVRWKGGEFTLTFKEAVRIDWGTLLLFGGGLSLGVAMTKSGLSTWVISLINFDTFADYAALGIISTITLVLSTFMSNTATTNLLMPIVTKIPTVLPLAAAIATALAASCAMVLPISTPPNAIAYGSNELKVKDMVKGGLVIGIISLVVLIIFSKYLIQFFI